MADVVGKSIREEKEKVIEKAGKGGRAKSGVRWVQAARARKAGGLDGADGGRPARSDAPLWSCNGF